MWRRHYGRDKVLPRYRQQVLLPPSRQQFVEWAGGLEGSRRGRCRTTDHQRRSRPVSHSSCRTPYTASHQSSQGCWIVQGFENYHGTIQVDPPCWHPRYRRHTPGTSATEVVIVSQTSGIGAFKDRGSEETDDKSLFCALPARGRLDGVPSDGSWSRSTQT